MNPYIYFSYLCFLDSGHPVKLAFERWKATKARWPLERAISDETWRQAAKYRRMYIYEAEKEWRDFSFSKFLQFLRENGFQE